MGDVILLQARSQIQSTVVTVMLQPLPTRAELNSRIKLRAERPHTNETENRILKIRDTF